jgi:poly(A) polymerase
MLKDGMKIEATHVKKKQLHQYLPVELVQRKKRVGWMLSSGRGSSFIPCLLLNPYFKGPPLALVLNAF